MAVTKTAKKDTSTAVKKAPAQAKAKAAAPKAQPKAQAAAPKTAAKKTTVKADASKITAPTISKAKTTATGKTAYHVSKRDNDGREWKVFIQGSDKVIKLFDTQKEALEYAKTLAKNKDDGSYVILHGLDGKIRKY